LLLYVVEYAYLLLFWLSLGVTKSALCVLPPQKWIVDFTEVSRGQETCVWSYIMKVCRRLEVKLHISVLNLITQ
jgi:hypothetical protein